MVAPPRGERGLKQTPTTTGEFLPSGRSPSWGAWIETTVVGLKCAASLVAPPRGERGLKRAAHAAAVLCAVVAPPRGERGLKRV